MSLKVLFVLICVSGVGAAQLENARADIKGEAPAVPQSQPVSELRVDPAPVAEKGKPQLGAVPESTRPSLPDAPPMRRTATADADEKKAAVREKSVATRAEGAPYIIGPLDVLMIKVWGQANLSGPVNVDSEGNISLALIGDVKADGLTKEQLKAEISKRLSDFLNNPEVDIQVVKINSKTYFVYGGVGHAGEFPLVKPTTLMDALSGVGGFRDFANTKKIYVLRTLPSGEVQKFDFNYKDVSKGKHMEQNIYLQSGDRVFVPE